MNDTLPEVGNNGLEAPTSRRPEAEAIADGEAAAARVHDLEASHALAEDPERRAADVKIWVENECDYFGIQPKDDPVADQLTALFCEHEGKQHERGRDDYDVTQDDPRRLNRIIERGMATDAETTETASLETAASQTEAEQSDEDSETAIETKITEEEEASADSYRKAVEGLEGQPNTEKIQALIADERVPETYKEQLRAFNRIMTIAAVVPGDNAIVTARINQIDMSQGVPDPVGFARSFLFDGPHSHLKSGVSDATQNAIAETLGIDRPAVDVTTGSEMTDVFENGVGTRMVRDPETGELREEPIFLEPGEFQDIRDGQSIGLTESGDRAMRFDEEVGSFTVILPVNATSEDMVMYGLAGQMMSQLHNVNMAEMMYPGRNLLERGGGVLDIRMPDDFNRTQQLCQLFFGAMAGFNGELMDQSDLNRIPYLMQFKNEKGDAVIGDVNPEQMRADYRRQGIIDAGGNFDWDLFATMVEANRLALWTGEENFAKTAKGKAV